MDEEGGAMAPEQGELVQDAFDGTVAATARGDRKVRRQGLRVIRRLDLSVVLAVTHRRVVAQMEDVWGDRPVPTHDVSGEPMLPELIDAILTMPGDGPGGKVLPGIVTSRRSGPWRQCVDACASLIDGATFAKPRKPRR